MIKPIRLILAVFATYRLASLISSEDGPYIGWPKSKQQIGIFKAIRFKAGAFDYDPNDGKPKTSLGRGISCPLCTGVYISGLLLVLVFAPSKVGDLFLAWMGISGTQVLLENWTSDDAIVEAMEDIATNMEE